MRIRKLSLAVGLAVTALLLVGGPAGAAEAEGGEDISHAAHECIEILEAGGEIDACQEAPNPILPEANELIWGLITFAVLFGLLAWKAFPAVAGAMNARTERIRDSIDEAERTRTEAVGVRAEYQRQLDEARNESARIIEEARSTADALRRDLTARAEAEAVELRQRNAEQIDAERDRVMAEVQGQVATLAIELAEKVVEGNLDREANLRLIENYINTVGTTGTGVGR